MTRIFPAGKGCWPNPKAGSLLKLNSILRTPEVTWIQEKSAPYRGQWVALLGDELLAHSESLDEVLSSLKQNKPPRRALLHYIT